MPVNASGLTFRSSERGGRSCFKFEIVAAPAERGVGRCCESCMDKNQSYVEQRQGYAAQRSLGCWRSPSSLQWWWSLVCKACPVPGCFVRCPLLRVVYDRGKKSTVPRRTSASLSLAFQRSLVMFVSLNRTHLPALTWTFTPSPPPKGGNDWYCTFSANGIRPTCATKRSRRHHSTARFAGFPQVDNQSNKNKGYIMSTKYTAIITNEEDWWIGWIVEIPGANAQERRKEGKKNC